MRKVVAAAVILAILLALAAPAVAQQDDDPWAPTDRGGTFEKILAGVVGFVLRLAENLFQAGGFKSVDELVFQQGLTEQEKRNLPWEANEPRAVRMWFDALCVVTAPFFILVIAVTGFKLKYAALNPAARAEAVESIQRWFLAGGLIVLAPHLVAALMWVASILVDAIVGAYRAVGAELGRDVADWGAVSVTGEGIATGSVLGTVVVRVFLCLMFFYLNVLYVIRKLVLTVMFAFTPLMALLWAMNRNVTAAAIWLGELASNAFMPVAHALVLCTILIMADVKNMGHGSWLTILVMLYGLIPAAEAVRNSLQSLFARWAGVGEESVARTAMLGGLGLGGFLALARVGAATFGGASAAGRAPAAGGSGSLPTGGPAPRPVRPVGFRPGGMETPAPRAVSGGAPGTGSGGPLTAAGPGAWPGPYGASYPGPAPGAQTLADRPPAYIGDRTPTGRNVPPPVSPATPRPGDATAPVVRAPQPSPRVRRAVVFGLKAGRAAALTAGVLAGAVAGAVPGGAGVATAATLAAGAAGRVLGTGAHLAAGYAARRAGPHLANLPGAARLQQAVGAARQAVDVPALRKATTAVRQVGIALQAGFDPQGAMRRAGHLERPPAHGLDGWRER